MTFDATTMAALLDSFLAESEEGLAQAEQGLLDLEQTPDDTEAIDSVFRAMHTIKGNAGIFDLAAVSELAHGMEDVLERIRAKKLPPSAALVSLLLEGVDALKRAIRECVESPRELSELERSLLARLKSATVRSRRKRNVDSDGPSTAQPAAFERPLRRTVRIDIAKLDRLLDLSGEIGIARGRVTQMIADPLVDRASLLEADRDAVQLQLDLQELVMKLRMLPIGPMLRQLHRSVRDLARSLRKEVDLRIEGDDVEVDMAVIDQLKDPLTHMIRNSVDHGIERPEVRAKAGKRAVGTITIRTYHDAGTVVIEVEDDGAGIDPSRILERARARGLVRPDEQLADHEAVDLLFSPGFSTAAEVTDVSGRGVGLDVVRRNIEMLHGTVSMSGSPGHGSRIRIRLPLTLAMIEGLRVNIGSESYIIPMEAVVEALDVRPGTSPSSSGMLRWRDEDIPFIRLRDHLRFGKTFVFDREHIVVVRTSDGTRIAFIVDGLYGECQTVVKPLARVLQGMAAISGSAILPDGRIAFIVDVPALINMEMTRSRAERSAAGERECSVV